MKVYIKDSLIVVNNKFENKIFIYDGSTRLEYQINEDTFSIIEDIKNNQYDEKQLLEIYPSDFINTLFAMGIITTEIQSNIHNVKRLTKYNNARIFIELTDKCNLKCKHCYGAFECKKNNTLDLELLKSVIDNASKAGVYQFDITGGEPFLYPKLKELLEYVYNAGMMVRIFSNLTLYNKNFKSLIVKYGVKEIVTSLDSCIKEDHDEFRGQIGSFEKTLKAIEDLKTTGVNISLNTMVGNHNKEHIEEMVTFISNLGVKSVLDVIVPEGRAKSLNEDIIRSSELIRDIYEQHNEQIDNNAISISCGVGNRFVYIKSDGNIYICPSLIDYEFQVGNIMKFDTTKIWKKMTTKFSKLGCCEKNSQCSKCVGGCRARALKLHGDINARDDVYCIINKVGCLK